MSWYGIVGDAAARRSVPRETAYAKVVAGRQRGHVAARRWDARRRMQLALTMLTDAALDVLITGESDFEDLPATMAQIAEGPANTLCHRIRYPAT